MGKLKQPTHLPSVAVFKLYSRSSVDDVLDLQHFVVTPHLQLTYLVLLHHSDERLRC